MWITKFFNQPPPSLLPSSSSSPEHTIKNYSFAKRKININKRSKKKNLKCKPKTGDAINLTAHEANRWQFSCGTMNMFERGGQKSIRWIDKKLFKIERAKNSYWQLAIENASLFVKSSVRFLFDFNSFFRNNKKKTKQPRFRIYTQQFEPGLMYGGRASWIDCIHSH